MDPDDLTHGIQPQQKRPTAFRKESILLFAFRKESILLFAFKKQACIISLLYAKTDASGRASERDMGEGWEKKGRERKKLGSPLIME